MRPQKITWREAVKLCSPLRCAGCGADDSDPTREWYITLAKNVVYCGGCAAKVAGPADAASSVTLFYADTRGTALVA